MSDTQYTTLITEAREYVDALQGGESANWMRAVECIDDLANALVSLLATTGGETEWEYRAKATRGHVVGESRMHIPGAILAYEEALDHVTLEQDDETPMVERRTVGGWVPVDPTSPEATERKS